MQKNLLKKAVTLHIDDHGKAKPVEIEYNPVTEAMREANEIAISMLDNCKKYAKISEDLVYTHEVKRSAHFLKHAKIAVSNAVSRIKYLLEDLEKPIREILGKLNEEIMLKIEASEPAGHKSLAENHLVIDKLKRARLNSGIKEGSRAEARYEKKNQDAPCNKFDSQAIIEKKVKQLDGHKRRVETMKILPQKVDLTDLRFYSLKDMVDFKEKEHALSIEHLTLSIEGNGVNDNGVQLVKKELLRYKNLITLALDFKSNNIGNAGCEFIGDGISDMKQLQFLHIDLYKNNVRAQGAEALAKSIGLLKGIKNVKLNLSCNNIGEKAISCIGNSLEGLVNLVELWIGLYDSGINDDSLKGLANSLKKMRKLSWIGLDVRLNNVSKKELESISTELRKKKLTQVEIVS